MKRSEALEAIKLELEDIRAENYFDEKGSEWCANLLLMKMDELGMVPPFNEASYNPHTDTTTGYTWEEE